MQAELQRQNYEIHAGQLTDFSDISAQGPGGRVAGFAG